MPDPERLDRTDAICKKLDPGVRWLATLLRAEIADAEATAALYSKRARSAPARKHEREALFDSVAGLWENIGGTVNRGRQYCAFFRAVVMPIARSEYGQTIGLEERPEPEYPDRDEVFRRHVRSYLARRGAN